MMWKLKQQGAVEEARSTSALHRGDVASSGDKLSGTTVDVSLKEKPCNSSNFPARVLVRSLVTSCLTPAG